MTGLSAAADLENSKSLSNRLRQRRFKRFELLCAPLPRPLRILDLRGTSAFWKERGWSNRSDVEIVTVNLEAESQRFANTVSRAGDATDPSEVQDKEFDIVFSNSVIERLFTFGNQRRMASEVQRVARAHWVQTPSYWFPIEPHFHIPGGQWLLRAARIRSEASPREFVEWATIKFCLPRQSGDKNA